MAEPRSPAGRALELGGRLAAPPSPELVAAFAGELDGQRGLAREIGLADLAHTVMLLERRLVPQGPGRELLRALLALQADPGALALDPAAGDLYTNREAWLLERTPAAGWLGYGRARREATTVAWHLSVRERVLGLAAALAGFAEALAARAAGLRRALAPDYTYLRAGQPTSVAHGLLAFAFPVLRDLERLRALHGRIDRSPAGCGSANGSRLPQDRRRLAALLGFGQLAPHARDAMWQADLPVEGLAAAVAALVNLSRFAEDLLFLGSAEVGLVTLADGHSRASKILPQKQNPYALAWLRACANEAIGALAGVAASGRTPTGQPDNRLLAYGEVPRILGRAADAARLAAAVTRGLGFDPARGRALAAAGFAGASDLAEALVAHAGLDPAEARRVVGALARRRAAGRRAPGAVTPAALAAAAREVLGRPVRLPRAALAEALDPDRAVEGRAGPGGAATRPVGRMLAEVREALAAEALFHAAARGQAIRAETALLARARALAEGRG